MNDFLNALNQVEGIDADFVARVDGVEVSTDRVETVENLVPSHIQVVEQLGYKWSQCWRAEQVHGGEVAVVKSTGEAKVVEQVDGLVTAQAGVVLGIYVADCGAVYIVDKKQKIVGLVHSGKKGTEANITGNAITAMMRRWGSQASDLLVALAPCIRPPHYEVDFAKTIRQQVLDKGVPEDQYFDSGICSGANVDTCYSYRIEKGNTGRMLALLGISK